MIVKLSLALGALSTLALASTAFAQTPAPAALAGGPPIPGVCIFWRDAAVGNSLVGKAVFERMKTLETYVNAELQQEAQSIQTEEKALESLTQDQAQLPANQQRIGQYQARLAAFQRKRQVRGQELQATQAEQVQNIYQQIEPIINGIYAERKCSLMIDRSSVFGANADMDVTKTVVDRLNAKITTVTFDRKHLDQGGGAQQAAAPAPAPAPAATPTKKKK